MAKGSARLWGTLEFDWRTIHLMHAAVAPDDLAAVLLLTEALLADRRAGVIPAPDAPARLAAHPRTAI